MKQPLTILWLLRAEGGGAGLFVNLPPAHIRAKGNEKRARRALFSYNSIKMTP